MLHLNLPLSHSFSIAVAYFQAAQIDTKPSYRKSTIPHICSTHNNMLSSTTSFSVLGNRLLAVVVVMLAIFNGVRCQSGRSATQLDNQVGVVKSFQGERLKGACYVVALRLATQHIIQACIWHTNKPSASAPRRSVSVYIVVRCGGRY